MTREASVEHLWTVVCRNVRTGVGGLLTLEDLIDMMSVPNLPETRVGVSFDGFVVSQWRRRGDAPGCTFSQRLCLQREDDAGSRVQLAGPDTVDVQERHLFLVVNQVPVLPLDGYAQYWFVVERDDGDGWRESPPTAGLWIPSPEHVGRP